MGFTILVLGGVAIENDVQELDIDTMLWHTCGYLTETRSPGTSSVIAIDEFTLSTPFSPLSEKVMEMDQTSSPHFTDLIDIEERNKNPILKWITYLFMQLPSLCLGFYGIITSFLNLGASKKAFFNSFR